MGIALDTVRKLRVVEFDWKHSGEHEIGLIAEEVAKVIPEAAWVENGKIQGLKPLVLIGVLVKAIQELDNGRA